MKGARFVALLAVLALPALAQDASETGGQQVTVGSPLIIQPGALGASSLDFIAVDSSGHMYANVPTGGNLVWRVNGSTQWFMSGSALSPNGDATENLGSAGARVADAFIRTIKNAGNNAVADFSGSSSMSLNGQVTDSSGAVGVRLGNVTTMTSTTDRYVAGFYRDLVSASGGTAVAFVQSNGHYVSNSQDMTVGSWAGSWIPASAAPEGTNFTGGFRATGTGGKMKQITCSWHVAGTGGTTGVVAKVRNVTDASTLCTCTLGACTTAVDTPVSCDCNATWAASKSYVLQFETTTDCTANPQQVMCSVELVR